MPRPRSSRSPRTLATERRVQRALRRARRGESPTRAAQREHTSLRTLRAYAPDVLQPTPTGRLQVAPSDRLPRRMKMPSPTGLVAVEVRSARSGSRVARYWSAVDHYGRTGDTARLAPFRGQRVMAGKHAFPFVTDPRVLDRLMAAGQVQFEDLYESAV